MKAPRYRAGKRLWEPEDDALLRARYPHEPNQALAAALGRSVAAINGRSGVLGLHKSAEYMASPAACRLRRGDNVGAAHRFPKGHVPANKGLRRPGWSAGRMRETQFKAGQKGTRWMPVGSTRLVDGYVYRKIADTPLVVWTRNWKDGQLAALLVACAVGDTYMNDQRDAWASVLKVDPKAIGKRVLEEVRAERAAPRCRKCGCTEFKACDGGCSWVEQPSKKTRLGLCSKCAPVDATPAPAQKAAAKSKPKAKKKAA